MHTEVDGVVIECICGDITQQKDCEAVVNAANAWLRSGGGVAGAIHRAAGPQLEKECRKFAPIKPGEAVITNAYNLPNRYVIHCLGPIYEVDKPSDKLLSQCYINALNLAEKYRISSIAFPAISCGAFGYPLEEAADIALKTVLGVVAKLDSVRMIRFVLYDSQALMVYEKVISYLL